MKRVLFAISLFCTFFQPLTARAQYPPMTGGTMTGPIELPSNPASPLQAVPKQYADAKLPIVNASLYAGVSTTPCGTAVATDIAAKAYAAGVATGWQGDIYIPAGSYSDSTSFCIPLSRAGQYHLTFDPAATIHYTGSGYEIQTYELSGTPTDPNLEIKGGIHRGTSSALGAILVNPAPGGHFEIDRMDIAGFTNGDGITLQGAILTNIEHNRIAGNKNGIRMLGISCSRTSPFSCGTTTGRQYAGYAPNANHIQHNVIGGNGQWGILEDLSNGLGYSPLNNQYANNDFELNGTSGPTYGAVKLCGSYGTQVVGNYFEGSPHNLTMCGTSNTYATAILNNYSTGRGGPKYTFELNGSIGAVISGNVEYTSRSKCFINLSGTGAVEYNIFGNTPTAKSNFCSGGSATVPNSGFFYQSGSPLYLHGPIHNSYTGTNVYTDLATSSGNIYNDQHFTPGAPAGAILISQFGVAPALNNAANISYGYVGSGATSNYMGFGLVGNDLILNVLGTRHVSIGSTSDCGYTLCVNGEIWTNQSATASATASNYSVPINISGTTYYIRLSNTP
jgi:hypothetical protein